MESPTFDPNAYSPAIASLLADDRLPELGPGNPNDSVHAHLVALKVESIFVGNKIIDQPAARCCLSALWLWHDFLDQSHAISQEIETADGSYWHAIMHRRELDYSNAKYWFRRVPEHPVYQPLAAAARELAAANTIDAPAEFLAKQSSWDAAKFVDLCSAIAAGHSTAEVLARQVARIEWQLLFDHCFRAATDQSAG